MINAIVKLVLGVCDRLLTIFKIKSLVERIINLWLKIIDLWWLNLTLPHSIFNTYYDFSKTFVSVNVCIFLIFTVSFILYSTFYNVYMPSKVTTIFATCIWSSWVETWSCDGYWLFQLFGSTRSVQQHCCLLRLQTSAAESRTEI